MRTVKTTVYLDEGAYRRLKALADAEGRPAAELIRAAVQAYVAEHTTRRLPRSLGAGCSEDPELAERYEEHLWETDEGSGYPS